MSKRGYQILWSVAKNGKETFTGFSFFVVCLLRFVIGWKFTLLSQPMRTKVYAIMTYRHTFSRAFLCRLHITASYSDWPVALFASLVIGQSIYFGFGFTTLI